MAERDIKKPRTRFKTVVSIFIAAVTVAGAIITWRIAVAGGKAEVADSQGLAAALNSANTAISVSTYLSSQQVDPTRFHTQGYGESQPVASNETPEGKAQNRRVEIAIFANDKLKHAAEEKSAGG